MPIRIDKFSGEIPKIIARLLPNSSAQIAQNTRLEDGSLLPFRCGKLVHTFETTMRTIYKYRGQWIGWPTLVDVVPAPIAEDRLYVTGAGAPQVITGGAAYPLALLPPAEAATVSQTEAVDPDLFSTLLYTYTYVTSLDEESEPAKASAEVTWSPGLTVTVSGFSEPPAGRLIDRIRIYRSQTSATGVTKFYLVKERDVTDTTSFDDNVTDNPIQEELPSTDYNPPSGGLRGLVALPNGIMAGFNGKKIYFSEPYIPHAWPEKYVLTTDYEIVGLGATGQMLAVMTKGHPYIVSGISPDSMTMERLRVNLACASKRGIVDLGYAVVYPSYHGLVSINPNGAQIMTNATIGNEAWQRLNPVGMISGHHNGRYITTYHFDTTLNVTDAIAVFDGSTATPPYVAPESTSGVGFRGMLIVDTTGEQPFLIRASDTATAMWNEPGTGKLYMLQGGTKVIEWDSPDTPYAEQLWRSKVNTLPGHTNFGALLVEGVDTMTDEERAANKTRWDKDVLAASVQAVGTPPFWLEPTGEGLLDPASPPTPGFCALVYADGRPIHVVTELNKPCRLPAGFTALSWEVEIRGTMQVTTVSLAGSPAEFARA